MEITIGVQNLPRELSVDTDLTADQVAETLKKALADGGVLELTDARGRRVLVPTATIGYVEVGPEETRRVGFGSL
ncbi:hypothetical protein Xcel_0776 [Xylanimonas cellulosilytica DSM 15894]|uniref:ATP-binding protein n=1 Tax=Xylanimonas cellulosilytica (strain DSM 15894 / JCM 12276 / CECT 5975 / KCTC 9989 / LMG 20990 / NBRC 107835 / XIL07) TaxID=446471 RepID=D1BXK4_XYLCX|nr:DUF3107 domain-containing protein [Xylanimonas cellulosilytica]ACZ29814.1 hypothetical protein Xcel_0776 [Xylanimonas cellulosilytica DSM 15894]